MDRLLERIMANISYLSTFLGIILFIVSSVFAYDGFNSKSVIIIIIIIILLLL